MKKNVSFMNDLKNRRSSANNLSMPSTQSTVLYNKISQPWYAIPTVNINST